ncbi:hypothetical protein O0L34_g4007 [Tuta absoluta]|nr:hypothetical protein O0L34_g13015 [Tuta absoluta]KAJ2944651.1 hypothetical protein O0L34_g4007 [Tuta absoluta]
MGHLETTSCTGSAPHVTQRLIVIIVLFIGTIFVFGLFVTLKKPEDISTYSLTTSIGNLYNRAKKMPPNYIINNEPDKIQAKLYKIFQCHSTADCGNIHKIGLTGLVRKCIQFDLSRTLAAVQNATAYLESLK